MTEFEEQKAENLLENIKKIQQEILSSQLYTGKKSTE